MQKSDLPNVKEALVLEAVKATPRGHPAVGFRA